MINFQCIETIKNYIKTTFKVRLMKHILAKDISPLLRFAHRMNCNDNIMVLNGIEYQTYDYRLFFCPKGEITLSVEGIEYHLTPDSAIYIPSGFKYRYYPETNKNAVLLGFNFDLMYDSFGQLEPINPDPPEIYSVEKQIEFLKVDDIDLLNHTIYIEDFGHFRSIMELILDTYKKEPTYFIKKCSGLLIYILMELTSNQTRTSSNRAIEIIEYIENNYSQKITNISISQHFNYHPYHLNRLIKQYTGVTLHQYIQNYRVSRAIELLNSTTLTTVQISEQVGFDTPQHFCTIFKKITGKKPSEYRPKF